MRGAVRGGGAVKSGILSRLFLVPGGLILLGAVVGRDKGLDLQLGGLHDDDGATCGCARIYPTLCLAHFECLVSVIVLIAAFVTLERSLRLLSVCSITGIG